MPRLGHLFLLGGLVLTAAGCGGDGSTNAQTIGIHYSRFTRETVEVVVGEQVTITLRNDDPIEHEWIVGDDEVHERHRTGTEPYHDAVPTEVTIPAFSTRATTLVFAEPGEYAYICHLPGHENYGMVGVLRVLPASESAASARAALN